MKHGVMGWGRSAIAAAAVCTLWSSQSAALPRAAAAFQAGGTIPGLAAYWPLDSNANDLSGNVNTGTLANGAVIDTVNFANGATPIPAGNTGSVSLPTLTGQNRINVSDSPSLSITGSITVAAWILTNLPVSPATLPNANQQEIVGKFDGGPPYSGGYYLRLTFDNSLGFHILPASGGPYSAGGTSATITTGVWTHVAGTYNQGAGGAITLYVNGAANSSTGTSPAPPSDGVSGLVIGQQGAANNFNGNIDEVRIYSRALTQPEVNTLFTGIQIAPTGLSATPGPAQITLTWMAATAATSYNIYRSIGGGAFVWIANTAGLTYTDTTVTNPTSYSYRVTAVGALESATFAGPVAAVPLSIAPKTTSGAQSNNLGHRCGCHTIGAPVASGILWTAAALAALALLLRRSC